MKKTLFLSLFCAAITISSIAGGKNFNKQETPKINGPMNRMVLINDGGGGGG